MGTVDVVSASDDGWHTERSVVGADHKFGCALEFVDSVSGLDILVKD